MPRTKHESIPCMHALAHQDTSCIHLVGGEGIVNDTHRISGRHILVTGAASGIGKASALELARRGARLSLADINLAGVQATAAEARAISPGSYAAAYEVDMAEPARVKE